jgi:hypothetical protein
MWFSPYKYFLEPHIRHGKAWKRNHFVRKGTPRQTLRFMSVIKCIQPTMLTGIPLQYQSYEYVIRMRTTRNPASVFTVGSFLLSACVSVWLMRRSRHKAERMADRFRAANECENIKPRCFIVFAAFRSLTCSYLAVINSISLKWCALFISIYGLRIFAELLLITHTDNRLKG